MDLIEQIDRWGHDAPDRVAHVSGGRALTYGELTRQSDAVAVHLDRVLGDDLSPVAVLGHKEPEMLVAFVGAVKAGHAYVPIDTSQAPRRVEQIQAAAGVRITLTPEETAGVQSGGRPNNRRRVGPDDPYYIMFTSGSTGEPKGVVITLGCLTSFVDWFVEEQAPVEGEERFLNQAPFSFDLSVMDTYGALATGGTLVSITRDEIASPKHLFQALTAASPTIWVSTPSFAQMCLVERSFREERLPGLRRFVFCGETLAPEVAAELLKRFPVVQVWNTYGPTEATVATTSIRVDADIVDRYSPLPIGYPMRGTRIEIVDEQLRPVPSGERGEIVIAGPNVSPGYLGRPDLNERAFYQLDGLRAYRTGDLGRYRDTMLFFEGRVDSQVKLHGYRIELGDVEANMRALPGVRDAVVLTALKDGRPDSLTAFVTLVERLAGSDFELSRCFLDQLADRLPTYMLPRRVTFLESFPMNANGKADRDRLVAMLA